MPRLSAYLSLGLVVTLLAASSSGCGRWFGKGSKSKRGGGDPPAGEQPGGPNGPGADCHQAKPLYDQKIASLLGASCTSCHAGAAAQAGVALDTYDAAKSHVARIVTSIESARMPPSGALPADQITAFKEWATAIASDAEPCISESNTPARAGGERYIGRTELRYTLSDVFGLDFRATVDQLPPREGGQAFANHLYQGGLSDAHLGEMQRLAQEVAETVVFRSGVIGRLRKPCTEERSCFSQLLHRLSLLLHGKPLTGAGHARLLGLFDNLDPALRDRLDLASYGAIVYFLSHPSAVFRAEVTPVAAARPLTSIELASRMSYFIWGSAPDKDLLTAALSDELLTDAGLSAQVDRMLASQKANRGLRYFLDEWLGLPTLQLVLRDAAKYPKFTPTLKAAMAEEVYDLFETQAKDDGKSFFDVFKGAAGKQTAELMTYYGSTKPFGLLATAGMTTMLTTSDSGGMLKRGAFVARKFFCIDLPTPGADVLAKRDDALKASTGTTPRLRFESATSADACQSCHKYMNPMGGSMEAYDAVGLYRTTYADGQPVNAAGTFTLGEEAWSFKDLGELSGKMAASPVVHRCFAKTLADFAVGARLSDAEADALVKQSTSYKGLVKGLVLSPAFREAAPAKEKAP